MITYLGKHVFGVLPRSLRHLLRRARVKYLDSARFQRFQKLREAEIDGYSLRPFDEHKCIFVHIPKCAGLSVSKSLFGNFGPSHIDIKGYQVIFSLGEFNRYFKFTFVRNPWDRMVSAYSFLKSGGMNEADRVWAADNLAEFTTFDKFMKKWVNRSNVRKWQHFRPQYEYICDYDGIPMVDFIGYYENLNEDFRYVQERVGIKSTLLSLNASNRDQKDYRSYYSRETAEILADVYREDIQMFGYTFEMREPQQRYRQIRAA